MDLNSHLFLDTILEFFFQYDPQLVLIQTSTSFCVWDNI